MNTQRDQAMRRIAAELGFDPDAEIHIGSNYTAALVHAGLAWISGQVPRIGHQVVAVGRVPTQVSIEQARRAAAIAALRGLVLLGRVAGGLDGVQQVLRVGVFVHSDSDFGGQSEVGDGASDVLLAEFGPQAGRHARTSVGVAQLPKSAAVEVELVAAIQVQGGDHA